MSARNAKRETPVSVSPLLAAPGRVHLTTIGARTGADRTVPLRGHPHGDGLVIVASNWGGPRNPGWYHNLRAHPDVRVAIDGRGIAMRARVARGAERERLFAAVKATAPQFGAYARKTKRTIPVVVLEPVGAARETK